MKQIRYFALIQSIQLFKKDFDDNTCTLVVREIESDEEVLDTVDDVVSSFFAKGLSITREAMERVMLLHNYIENGGVA